MKSIREMKEEIELSLDHIEEVARKDERNEIRLYLEDLIQNFDGMVSVNMINGKQEVASAWRVAADEVQGVLDHFQQGR